MAHLMRFSDFDAWLTAQSRSITVEVEAQSPRPCRTDTGITQSISQYRQLHPLFRRSGLRGRNAGGGSQKRKANRFADGG